MIVVFRTEASGDVIMFGDVARRMMQLMGKEPADKGVVTVEQLPEAIAGLKAAIADDKAHRAGQRGERSEEGEDDAGDFATGGRGGPGVTLVQRAFPLLEQLERALKKKKPVTWGV